MVEQVFKNKVAVVTGASGGIGSTCARMLASRGASVVLMDLSDCSAQAAAMEKDFQTNCTAITVNVTDIDSVRESFSQLRAWKGRLDLCVNAAGVFIAGHHIDSESLSNWSKTLAVNLSGVFYCLQQEIQTFLQLGCAGSIVNVSSDAGSVASLGCAAYVASKHGVNGLTKTAALEYARSGVRVNAVAPGNVETAMIAQYGTYDDIARSSQPTGRCGRPEEIAELICFLLSDRAAFMTGSIVAIDGGITTAGFSGYHSSSG